MVFKITEELKTDLDVDIANLVFSFRGKCTVDKDDSTGNRTISGFAEVRTADDYTKRIIMVIRKSIACPDPYPDGSDPVALLYAALKLDYSGRTITDL